MKIDEKIIVVTPTYNRVDTLPKLYNSLVRQNNKSFKWLIVDDGSNDGTGDYVRTIQNEKLIDIFYVFQNNGGKARALNRAFELCKQDSALLVVDSDDYLTENAIDIVEEYIRRYGSKENIGAFFFHYKTDDGRILKPIGKVISNDKIMTRYEYNNKFTQNDGCICYLGNAVKKYKYPEFIGEKYIGPTVIQMDMADEYKIVFSPEVIGVAKYLEDGLSKAGRKLRLQNPKGMIFYSNLMMSKKAKIKTQIKYAISIWPYAKIANMNTLEIFKLSKRPFLLFLTFCPGKILAIYWSKNNNENAK